MAEWESEEDRGQVVVLGRCQVCGAIGETIEATGTSPPNQLCAKCAIEYGPTVLVEDEDRRRSLGASARALAIARYSWDDIGRRLAGIYELVAGGAPAGVAAP